MRSPTDEFFTRAAFAAAPSYHANIACLLAFGSDAGFERYALVLRQAFEAFRLYILKMRKQILAAIVGRNKTETFCVIEPFDCASLSAHDISYERVRDKSRKALEIKIGNQRESNRNGSMNKQDGRETDNNDDLTQVQRATIQANARIT